MTESDNRLIIAICPECKSKYKLPEAIVGKLLACKQCGTKFTVQNLTEPKPSQLPSQLLVKIALENKLLTEEKLKVALGIQAAVKKAGRDMPLEDILIKKEMISRENMRRLIVATVRQLDKTFARIAEQKYQVPADQIQQALSEQAAHFKATENCILIGDILVASGQLSPENKDAIMATQQRTGRLCSLLRSEELKPIETLRRTPTPQPNKPEPKPPPQETSTEERGATEPMPSPQKSTPEPSASTSEERQPESPDFNETASEKIEIKKEIFKDKKFFNIRKMDKELVGTAIAGNLLTRKEADRALAEQLHLYESAKKRVLVGDLLVADGVLTAAIRDQLLEAQQRVAQSDSRFCEIAIAKGMVVKGTAEKAMTIQTRHLQEKRSKIPVGEILIKMGVLTTEQMEAILAEQTDFEPSSTTGTESQGLLRENVTIGGHPFEFRISDDRLTALIRKVGEGPLPVSAADIRSFLADQKITHGIVDDSRIEAFLKKEGTMEQPVAVASGRPSRAGRAGSIKYYFNTEHLTVGAVKEDGYIDFKDRGEIPHVAKGDLIAEKIPMIAGEQGFDVFGEVMPVAPVSDIRLREGAGVTLSEDGMRAFAKTDGQPDASFGGKVAVLSEIHIKEDIGLETGHVEFEGNVRVGETIQSGFRVQAASISAKEILSAEIHATGDVVVSGGITGAKIKTQGGVQAKYIKNADISAFGDIITQKEILDSTIETSGACIVRSGKIISSEICAKKGIEAQDIGTDISTPCKLKIDVDKHLENELRIIKEAVTALQEQKSALEDENARMAEEEKSFESRIALLAQEQDRAQVEIRSLKNNISSLSGEENAKTRTEMTDSIKTLEERARNAETSINALFEKQDAFAVRSSEIKTQIIEIENKIKIRISEREDMLQWAGKQKGTPAVKARGVIAEGTAVFGPHASIILRESRKSVQIKETRIMNPDKEEEWEMRVSTQKL